MRRHKGCTSLFWLLLVLFPCFHLSLSDGSHDAQSPHLSRSGPATTLKLFTYLGYNSSLPHLVFSPLAFKLTLLSIASLGTPTQEQAINQLLFDEPVAKSSLGLTFTQDDAPTEANLVPRNETTAEEEPFLCLSGLEEASPRYRSLADQSLLPENYCQSLSPSTQARLCLAFSRSRSPLTSPTTLTRPQKLALCQAFGVDDFTTCVRDFIGDPSDLCPQTQTTQVASEPVTNAALAYLAIRQFHRSEERSEFIHRIALLNESLISEPKLWSDAKAWYQMVSFDLPGETLKWEEFKRDALPNELYELELYPPQTSSSFLNLISFDFKLARTFNLYHEKAPFYGPKGVITQVDTFMSNPAIFPIVLHSVDSATYHTLVGVPYENEKYSLVLLLPDANSTVPQMLSSLTSGQLDYYLKRLLVDRPEHQVVLTFPRFNLTSQYDFGPLLLAQNLSTFNLERVAPSLRVSSSLQQTIHLANLGVREPARLVLEARYPHEQSDIAIHDILPINRPFVYLVTGKYVDGQQKAAFEVLIAGYYNGPE